MQCPICQHTSSRVLESRSADSGKSIRRRRECLNCKHRFTTYERIERVPVTVIKRDGKRESFERAKLLRGLVRACEKTGITAAELETIINEIEIEFQQRSLREVSSQQIGEFALEQLKQISEVAYIRFASVYQQFQGIRDFVETLAQFKQNHPQLEETKEPHNISGTTETATMSTTVHQASDPLQAGISCFISGSNC
ncbi:MAG: transcriptional regulator NrdR [Microcoleaceae cyanobacterium]